MALIFIHNFTIFITSCFIDDPNCVSSDTNHVLEMKPSVVEQDLVYYKIDGQLIDSFAYLYIILADFY